LFKFANTKLEARFEPGEEASFDYFLQLLVDPRKNSPKVLKGLFELHHRGVPLTFQMPRSFT
jgi:hypothetical protein